MDLRPSFRWLPWLLLAVSLGCPPLVQAQDLITDLDTLRARYAAENGGEEGIEKARSMRLTGVLENSDGVFDLTIVRKRPNLKLDVLRNGQVTVRRGYDGAQGWTHVHMDGRDQLSLMDQGALQDYLLDADFDGPLVGDTLPSVSLKLVGTERVDRDLHYVVEEVRPQLQRRLYIDVRTLRQTRIVSTSLRDGQEVVAEERHSDFRRVANIWVPMTVERYEGDTRVARFNLSEVEFDVGIFDSFFSPPTQP